MKKLTSILAMFFTVGILSGCADEPPVKSGNSPESQRAHADRAQGELSSEVKK